MLLNRFKLTTIDLVYGSCLTTVRITFSFPFTHLLLKIDPIPGRASLFILNHIKNREHDVRHVIEPNDHSVNVGSATTSSNLILEQQLFSNPNRNSSSITVRKVLSYPKDGLFDLTWSENDPNTIWTASGDGSILVYSLDQISNQPVNAMKGHEKEISCIEWSNNRLNGPIILTSSWDGTIKSWDGIKGSNISQVCPTIDSSGAEGGGGEKGIIYCVSWSPIIPRTFCSSNSDGSLKVYDLNDPSIKNKGAINIPSSKSELLSCDWNKYNQNIIVTSSVDGFINGFDIRSPFTPLFVLSGHSRAIKKIKCSPFKENIIASVSYDFTTRVWDLNNCNKPLSPLIITMQNHTEFVYGLDFSLHHPDVLVDCSWDQSVVISSPFDTPSTGIPSLQP